MSNGLGVLSEEASAVQPVSIRQGRGARLSLLGGRKKDQSSSPQTNGVRPTTTHEDGEALNGRTKSMDKDQSSRRSFFRGPAVDATSPNGDGTAEAEGSEWVTESRGRQSSDMRSGDADRENDEQAHSGGGNGLAKKGSVRKRFSMLRLGKKTSRGNVLMGSVDEE